MEIMRREAAGQNLSRVLTLSAKSSRARFCGAALPARPKRQEMAISMDQVREIAVTEPIPLSLRQMRTFADGGAKVRVASAKFLHKELRSRFARAIVELSDLPLGLSNTAAIQQAIDVYRRELQWISATNPPNALSEDRQFTENLRQAKLRGSNLVPIICYALQQQKVKDLDFGALQLDSVQQNIKERLDRFFMGRIGIRMLVGHYIESLERPGGRVDRVNPEEIVREACERARKLCIQYCGEAPPVDIRVTPSASLPFMYVRSHLHHMVFELVKNSMRATVEHHQAVTKQIRKQEQPVERVMNPNCPSLGFFIPAVEDVAGVKIFHDAIEQRTAGALPPVEIVICQGKEDLTVKVSDHGGGIPRSRWDKLWHYDYSTSPLFPPVDPENYPTYREQFSGGGYGLPMARLFARYFGGDITFSSQEGVGSTGFIQAHRLGTNMESVVPLRRRMQTPALNREADRLAA